MQRMDVLGVRVLVSTALHDVVVLLHEAEGARSLPILIGPHEGVAIAAAQGGVRPPRPGPYELLLAALEASGQVLVRVQIVGLTDGTFYAELVLSNGNRVDARASDSIALAVRADVEVWCAEEVLEVAGMELDDLEGEELSLDNPAGPEQRDAAMAEFREFLETVTPEDFAAPAPGDTPGAAGEDVADDTPGSPPGSAPEDG